MHFAAIGIAALTVLIWIYLFFFNGHFWQIWISDADREAVQPPAAWPGVIAIVPARNEAATIAQTISALARQDYEGKFPSSSWTITAKTAPAISRGALRRRNLAYWEKFISFLLLRLLQAGLGNFGRFNPA